MILDAVTYDAVCAVVINAEALTHDAENALIDCDANKDWVALTELMAVLDHDAVCGGRFDTEM